MKKLTITCFLMLIAAFISAGTIKYTYHFNNPSVKQAGTFQVIAFDNTLVTGNTGEPALPYQAVRLLLPPGEEAVSVNYSYEDESILEGTFNIYPQQPSQPISLGSDGIFHQDKEIYASRNIYPAEASGEYSTHFMNGHSFLLTTFTPVKYIPADGKVYFFKNITITVRTRSTGRASKALENLNTTVDINSRVRALAQNSSMISAYPAKNFRDGEYQILIIAPLLYTNYYQSLKDLYLVRGLKTEIIASETIDANGTGQDLQEKIRNYIIGEYQDHGIEHVLLGGDAELIPYRGFYCIVYSSSTYEDSNIPADLYYSALDGNWNNDGDGNWGEIGEDDLLPEVSVARFPVSTVAQLQSLLHKTIIYQDAPVQGELRNILMAGEQLWTDPLTYGEDYLELLIGHRDTNGYVTDGMPENLNFTRLYDSQASWGGYDLINSINQGKTFIHHSGHANETYVMRLMVSDITNSNFAQTNGTDHNYPFIYTHGCLDGAFDYNECIGEAMVCIDNFAVGGAFNSRYGWFNEGQSEGPSAHLHREFVNALYHDKESHMGAAHMISKIETSVWVNAPGQWEEGALRWCFYDCNIFGDPALALWTDEPASIETYYPDNIPPGTTSVPVTVTSNGQPATGLMCTILSDGIILGSALTDSSGQAVISVPGGFNDVTAAELIVSGYDCLPNHYDLNISVGLDEIINGISDINVLPNPFTDQVKLVFKIESDRQVMISLYQLTGQLIGEFVLNGRQGSNEFTINTIKWPEGLIQARIISGNRVIHTQLIHIKK
jgi:hypothetical protein